MSTEKSLSVIQHDVFHSIQSLIHTVTIASSMILVHRLENCKPADNSQESLLKTIHAFCWIAIVLTLIKAFVVGVQYNKNTLSNDNTKATHGLHVATHIVMTILAILNLSYLSKTNINKCTGTQDQMAIYDSSHIDMSGIVTWVVVLSMVVLISNLKHLIWMIGTTSQGKGVAKSLNLPTVAAK